MAETDILNPVQGYWSVLGDSPTWNYDYTRKKAINKSDVAARLGSPYSRDIGNAGHAFAWNWVNRPLATMQRLQRFYDDFKHGYFTIIDWDNGGRHYVGRFTAPPNAQLTGHTTWTAQAVQFQEQPKARMLAYPSNFAIDGHPINVVDDYLNPRVAVLQGAWYPRVNPLSASTYFPPYTGASYPTPQASIPEWYEMYAPIPAANDAVQVGYVGWGFQLIFRLDPAFGICNILLDGVGIFGSLDLNLGVCGFTAVGANIETIPGVGGAPTYLIVSCPIVPLDQHYVTLQCTGANAGSLIFPTLEYIY